jgi:ketosteroid isomerase-like protein
LSADDGIRRVFDAFRGGDPRALFEVIAEDAVWIVNGTVPVANVYEGREQIFTLFRETRRLTGGTYLSTLKWSLSAHLSVDKYVPPVSRRVSRKR